MAVPLLGAGLSGCAAVQEAASDQLSAAACATVVPAVESAGDRVGGAVESFSVDPERTLGVLTSTRDGLDAVGERLSGDARVRVAEIVATVEELIALGEAAREGPLDGARVGELQDRLMGQIEAVAGSCEEATA